MTIGAGLPSEMNCAGPVAIWNALPAIGGVVVLAADGGASWSGIVTPDQGTLRLSLSVAGTTTVRATLQGELGDMGNVLRAKPRTVRIADGQPVTVDAAAGRLPNGTLSPLLEGRVDSSLLFTAEDGTTVTCSGGRLSLLAL